MSLQALEQVLRGRSMTQIAPHELLKSLKRGSKRLKNALKAKRSPSAVVADGQVEADLRTTRLALAALLERAVLRLIHQGMEGAILQERALGP